MIKIPRHIGTLVNGGHLELHEDAVTQGFGILAKRGKGKTTLAGAMEETFARRGQSFVVLDPPNAHWGIRFAADGDGKPCGPGFENILLVGGERGDVPLDPRGGKELAGIIVEGDISAVIEMRDMGFTERQKFCADFAEELFRINRTPRHIFFEESQNFCPQQLKFEEQKRVLYAMEKLITEGRGLGLGYTLISQRPALVNKNVLTQVDNLFVLGMIGPQDIDQVKDWFKHHVRDKERLEEILDELPRMKPGEAWFLSPEWREELVKLRVRHRVTYHAGRTPKLGERSINVDKFTVTEAVQRLKKLFASKQADARKEVADLKEAKLRIRELETEIRKSKSSQSTLKSVSPKSVSSDPKAMIRAIQKAVAEAERPLKAHQVQLVKTIQKQASILRQIAEVAARSIDLKIPKIVISNTAIPIPSYTQPPAKPVYIKTSPTVSESSSNGNGKLRAGAERMLAALATWSPNGMSEGQMRAHAGMKKSGTFSTYMGDLRRGGFIYENGDMVFATEEGLEYCQHVPQAPQTTEEVLNVWRPKLRDGARRMLEVLVGLGGETIDREELAVSADLANSGTFSTYLGDLRTARLAVVSRDGTVKADKDTLLL